MHLAWKSHHGRVDAAKQRYVSSSADEAAALIGKSSGQIEATLGYCGEEEMIHRDNLVRG